MSRRLRRTALVLAPLAVAGAVATAPAAGAAPVPWAQAGPHKVKVDDAPNHRLYRPADLGNGRTKFPVVIWGNGTGARPAAYDGLLRHWAGHGFIVAAAKTTAANDGAEMREGLDVLATRNSTASSPYHQKVDLGRVVSAGHSQGGAGSLNAASDARVDAVLPIQPGPLANPGAVTKPTLYLAGQNDKVVQPGWVRGDYNASSNRPAAYGELRGADHLAPTGNGGPFRGISTAWLYFVLRGDAGARAMFGGPSCGYCTDTALLSAWQRNAKFVTFAG
ncbi:chlorophyllase/cutinase-like alpha/beta fold protein [Actinomadura flavalba]|uniref:poly(ethylene terephthalate) hydrolase family protein n=1 Tax=Actinomadura flavalba TaxID=1120938 RepID=UPI00036835DF|nr:alpha/beta hydrolase [Actinomadura flavalba]